MNVITRFPPSPTGNLHIGGARTALFNFLFARHHGGKIFLRLEDTDQERSKKEYEENILNGLSWLNLSFDPAPDGKPFWRQSERVEIYRTHLERLLKEDKAYLSKEEAKDGSGERELVRFRNPGTTITFADAVRGEISFDTAELGDFVIAKSLNEPLYHLAVVVDDALSRVTHVLRGEDHISNTPRQVLLLEALGLTRPTYAHIPLILAPDRSKLSKRHGAVSLTEYREKGYLPEAFINYLALLGWNPGTDQELFSLEELVNLFDISKVQKGGAIFNEEKLRWMNKEYMKKAGPHVVIQHIPEALLSGRSETERQALSEMFVERISALGEIEAEYRAGEFSYLLETPSFASSLLHWKKAVAPPEKHLEKILSLIDEIPDSVFVREGIRAKIFPYADAEGKGDVLWPMRVALSGKEKSPDPFTLAAILGKRETRLRLQKALAMVK